MIRLVQSYSTETPHTVQILGRSFDAPCLVEDDDGMRWFITDTTTRIHAQNWAMASANGAVGIIAPGPQGYSAMLASTFMDERVEDGFTYRPTGQWIESEAFPTYAQVLTHKPQSQQGGFVHLHTHSEYSALDGLSTIQEIVDTVVENGDPAVAITDHGNVVAHPILQVAADKAGIRPVFGIEAYFVDDRITRPEKGDADAVKALKDYFHLILWAENDAGLKNLWAMSTESNRTGFYGKPRMDWDVLQTFSEGVIASTGCLRGPLSHGALLDGNEDVARARLARLLDVFGDRLYIEMHVNQLEEQIKVNHGLVTLARDFGVPMVAAVDSHYARPQDSLAHRTWLSIQTNNDISDDSSLFAGGQDYSLQTEVEVRKHLSYLGEDVVNEAVANTVTISEMCDAKVEGKSHTPIFSKGKDASHSKDADRLIELCLSNWSRTLNKRESQDVYEARFEREIGLLIDKEFCGYFLQVADYCNWARSQDILVGPGRGSGGGSLVAYLCGIVGIDPVDADLLFERFLTEGRTSLPDFDVDFPQSKKKDLQEYVRDKYGDDYVAVVGSILKLKSKGIVKDLAGAMKSTLPPEAFMDLTKFSEFVKVAEADTAGLGMPWEDLWVQHDETLAPFREKYPDLFDMADQLVGRVKTYGQHAAGLIISTDEPLTGALPLRRAGEEGHMVSQFDKDVLEILGYTKFDILTLRTLDTIQQAIDLIKERRGVSIQPAEWQVEYEDPQVWEEVAAGHTLGIFQIETPSGTALIKQMKPRNLSELAAAVTLVRPGPKNSGLTKLYLERREGLSPVHYLDPRMEPVLSDTYGAMIYQEQVMAACMVLAGYDSTEADTVRSILGKKKVEKVQAAGIEFVQRAVEHGMDQEKADVLWAQMAEFAKYSFNRAHAFGYAVLAYWCAWLKFHYPVEFLTGALSTVDNKKIPPFIKEARRLGLKVLPPDINESGKGFRASILAVRYGLDSIKGVGQSAVDAIVPGQPYTSFDDFMERKGPGCNKGDIALLARIGAFDSIEPNRRGLEELLLGEKTGASTQCIFKEIGFINEHNLPCHFDWESEEVPVNKRTGKKLKAKPPPKKCTKACRNYTAPPPMQISEQAPYTDADIREIEMEMLGVYLSTTPFDRLSPEDREATKASAEQQMADGLPEGSTFLVACTVNSLRPHTAKNAQRMGFASLETETNQIDTVVFSNQWTKYSKMMKPGTLGLAEVVRTQRGWALNEFLPVP